MYLFKQKAINYFRRIESEYSDRQTPNFKFKVYYFKTSTRTHLKVYTLILIKMLYMAYNNDTICEIIDKFIRITRKPLKACAISNRYFINKKNPQCLFGSDYFITILMLFPSLKITLK